MDLTGWAPVTDAAGKVLGWTSAPDPDEPDVDYFEADRLPRVRRRADVLGQAAALFADPAFDIEQSYAVAEAAMPGADVNAASYIGLILREVELGGGGD